MWMQYTVYMGVHIIVSTHHSHFFSWSNYWLEILDLSFTTLTTDADCVKPFVTVCQIKKRQPNLVKIRK